MSHFNGRFPVENGHRDTITAIHVTFHLQEKVIVGIEFEMVVEAFLVVPVAALYLTVVPWSPGPDLLVLNTQILAKKVQRMNAVGLAGMRKFATVIRLNDPGSVSKIGDGALYKINRGVTALLTIRIDKAFPGCLVNHGVLVEALRRLSYIARGWNVFYIHLPFHAELFRRIIMPRVPRQLLC